MYTYDYAVVGWHAYLRNCRMLFEQNIINMVCKGRLKTFQTASVI